MKLSSPLPQPLSKECLKAAKIFNSFVDHGNNGLDGVIPRTVLENAKGFAIFTIFKAGFVFSARAGSGVVIAKLDDGTWSAPSAIGTAGLGFGGQAGAEMTDFLVVLNSRSAIQSFMAAGSLTLGGNMSVALGPLGRNGEAVGSLNTNGKMAAMYSYSKTRGLFGGLSIEGSVIMERQDANAQAYQSPVTARMLLGGIVERPSWAIPLIKTLESCTGMPGGREWVQDSSGRPPPNSPYAFGGLASPGAGPSSPSISKKQKADKSSFPPASWGSSIDSGSYFSDNTPRVHSRTTTWDLGDSSTASFQTKFEPEYPPQKVSRSPFGPYDTESAKLPFNSEFGRKTHTPRSFSLSAVKSSSSGFLRHPAASPSPFDDYGQSSIDEDDVFPFVTKPSSKYQSPPYIKPKPELSMPLLPHEGVAKAIALYDFKAVEAGDLSFSKGDVIIVTLKSDSSDDWWTGRLRDREGIFPANFVEVA